MTHEENRSHPKCWTGDRYDHQCHTPSGHPLGTPLVPRLRRQPRPLLHPPPIHERAPMTPQPVTDPTNAALLLHAALARVRDEIERMKG